MKFQFKPNDNILSFREYLRYLNKTSPVIIIYFKTITSAFLIFIFTLFTYLFSSILSDYYTSSTSTFIVLIALFVLVLLVTVLLILLIIKVIKKKKLKNTNIHCDIESTFYFTIDDGYLIRENDFSYIKLELSKLKEVKLLDKGLVLSSEDERILIFIPKDALPVTLDEFISLLKAENSSLIVIEEFKILKKSLKKLYIIFITTLILSVIFGFFIGKYNYEHNFTKYDLISNSELIKQDNKSYLYENKELGISLTFSNKWENKFGIEEFPDKINVYYLVDGKQSYNTTLLFSIRGLNEVFDTNDFNVIRSNELYMFLSPTSIHFKKDSKEYLEYNELYKDKKNIQLRKNKYYKI